MAAPMRNIAKRLWAHRPDNWYRDVWLFAITVLVFFSVNAAFNQSAAIQHSRERAIGEACRQQNARNVAAYGFLNALPVNPNSPRMSPVERRRLIQKFTDALVGPVQNCEKRVQQVTR
jgi:hypothetical protein